MPSPLLAKPVPGPIRGTDSSGSGAFGALRGGRLHRGIDICCEPGETVRSPVSGVVGRLILCYEGDIYTGASIDCDWCEVRLLYVNPTVRPGDSVVKFDAIGEAQDITKRYPNITNHIHFEVRLKSGAGALEGKGRPLQREVWANPMYYIY